MASLAIILLDSSPIQALLARHCHCKSSLAETKVFYQLIIQSQYHLKQKMPQMSFPSTHKQCWVEEVSMDETQKARNQINLNEEKVKIEL